MDIEKAKAAAIENENKAKELLSGIAESFRTSPETMAEVFSFAKNFYAYSPRNTKLIYAQNPYATFCQSYPAWKKMGAPVLSGQHGLKIWVPVQSTLLEPEPGKFVQLINATAEQKEKYMHGEILGYTRTHFKIGTTFDISQTSFPKERYPEIYSMGFSSEEHRKIYQAICDFSMEKLGCPVKEEFVSSISLRGYYIPKEHRIVLNDQLEDTQKLATMLHEMGHAIMHHSMPNSSVAQKELEADAISIMLESSFGIESSDARKRHFVSHYEIFKKEVLELANELEDTDRVLDRAIDNVFDEVFQVYREHINDIQQYVDKYIPREVSKDLQQVKENKRTPFDKGKSSKDSAMQRAMKNRSERSRKSFEKKNSKGLDL